MQKCTHPPGAAPGAGRRRPARAGPDPGRRPCPPAAAEQLARWAEADLADEAFHPVAAFVDGACVGASAILSFRVAVPGGGTAKMAGVTATGVIATHGDLMCPANNGTWRLRADGPSVTCGPTGRAADPTLTVAALGSLSLGGMSAHDLAYAGQITEHTEGAVGRLARLFRTDPEPHNSFGF